MDYNREEIINRLLQLDRDMALIDTTEDIYSCVIVGGGALVLMNKIYRSTHDIDSIDASKEIIPLLEAYNINMNVRAYVLSFPDNYRERVQKLEIGSKKINFYTASLEDLVVSKLNSMRDKDIDDISNPLVYNDVNWEVLDLLIEDVCYGMLNDYDVNNLRRNYSEYKEKYKK